MAAVTTPAAASLQQPTQPSPQHPSHDERRCNHWRHIARWDLAYAREMLPPLGLGLLLLVLVLAGNFVYWAINSVVNQGLGVAPVARLFLLTAPGFAVQGIPVGVILAVCLVLNRAVRDNEIIALRVGGVATPRILAPFLMVALLASLADWTINEKIAPRTNDLAEQSLMQLMSRTAAPLIDTDKYFRAGKYYFYVGGKDGNTLRNVMVYERGSGTFGSFAPTVFPVVLIAAAARQATGRPGVWVFENVVQHLYNANGSQLSEARLDRVTLDIGQQITTYWQSEKQAFSMTSDELSQRIEALSNAAFDQGKLREMRVDYYRRFSVPFASFVLALLAAPLALRFAHQGSFAGLVLAFALGFLWQGCDGWFRALGIAGYLQPVAAAWATDLLFLGSGAFFLWRSR